MYHVFTLGLWPLPMLWVNQVHRGPQVVAPQQNFLFFSFLFFQKSKGQNYTTRFSKETWGVHANYIYIYGEEQVKGVNIDHWILYEWSRLKYKVM